MVPAFCPAWAEVFGEDEFGVFAEFTLKEVRFVWRWVPPGKFLMGSPVVEQGRGGDEGPQHEVTITRGFWMGETPVTQAQWMALMPKNPSRHQGPERPLEMVNWFQGIAFADELNVVVPGLEAGLPSEAQWEYACRAGTKSAFHDGSPCTLPEGNDPALDRLGWFDENNGGGTHPVKHKLPNAWGLHDLHGNVWEWCLDVWQAEAYETRRGGAVDLIVQSLNMDRERVVRGGSWLDTASDCRAAVRAGWLPSVAWESVGLRLATGQQHSLMKPPGFEQFLGGEVEARIVRKPTARLFNEPGNDIGIEISVGPVKGPR
jgi:formylglycine-generating enzyme required for sulfatase activity